MGIIPLRPARHWASMSVGRHSAEPSRQFVGPTNAARSARLDTATHPDRRLNQREQHSAARTPISLNNFHRAEVGGGNRAPEKPVSSLSNDGGHADSKK